MTHYLVQSPILPIISSMSSIGCEFRIESHSGCAFWHTAVFMEQRRRTLLEAFPGHLMSTLDVVCVLLTQPCWWYHQQCRRSTLGDRAFSVASARAWNSLPSSVRNAPSLTTFCREIKTVLFRSSFDND